MSAFVVGRAGVCVCVYVIDDGRIVCYDKQNRRSLTTAVEGHATSSCEVVLVCPHFLNCLLRHDISCREEHLVILCESRFWRLGCKGPYGGGDALGEKRPRGQLHLVPGIGVN